MAPNLAWGHQPFLGPSLLQWWSRNHRLQTQLGKLLLRDGAILSKQHPMSPAGHLLKTLLDIALESLTRGFENENRPSGLRSDSSA